VVFFGPASESQYFGGRFYGMKTRHRVVFCFEPIGELALVVGVDVTARSTERSRELQAA